MGGNGHLHLVNRRQKRERNRWPAVPKQKDVKGHQHEDMKKQWEIGQNWDKKGIGNNSWDSAAHIK